MDLVFSTDSIERRKRYAAWQGAICDVYVHVDVNSEQRSDYRGFIREARFGAVTMTDVLLSEQKITRRQRHIAQLDKDCYYVQFLQRGKMNVLQAGKTLVTNAGTGAIFCATESYDLECVGEIRSFYLELPRKEFADRFPNDRIPVDGDHGHRPGAGPDSRRVLFDTGVRRFRAGCHGASASRRRAYGRHRARAGRAPKR